MRKEFPEPAEMNLLGRAEAKQTQENRLHEVWRVAHQTG